MTEQLHFFTIITEKLSIPMYFVGVADMGGDIGLIITPSPYAALRFETREEAAQRIIDWTLTDFDVGECESVGSVDPK